MACSANRNTTDSGFDVIPHLITIPVTANVHIYEGSLVGLDSNGRARPMAASATTPICIGRAEAEANNLTAVTGGAAGAISVLVKCGCFYWDNDTSTPITNASRGSICYAKDDCTVTGSSSSNAIAGTVIDVPGSTDPNYGQVLVQTLPSVQSGSDATAFAANLVSVAQNNGAALVGIYDADGNTLKTNVEDALAELYERDFNTQVVCTLAQVNGANLAAGKTLVSAVTNKAIYLSDVVIEVNGATAWDTLASLTISDDNTAVTNFAVINVAALTGNNVVRLGMTDFLPKKGMVRGAVTNCNLVMRANANANGNGSNLNVRVRGRIA